MEDVVKFQGVAPLWASTTLTVDDLLLVAAYVGTIGDNRRIVTTAFLWLGQLTFLDGRKTIQRLTSVIGMAGSVE